MAKTQQTAKRSTGGSAPRKQLAAMEARRRTEERETNEFKYPPGTAVDYIKYNGKGEYTLKVENDTWKNLREPQLKLLLDPFVLTFCMHNRGLKVTAKTAVWWGLLDKEGDGENYSHRDYTVRWVKFDPELGVEGDGVKGGFLGRAAERSLSFPIRMYSLGGLENGPRVPKGLMNLFDDCTTRFKGKWREVGRLGARRSARSEALAPYIFSRDSSLTYRSTEFGGCVPMAAANVVHAYDSEAAEKISKCEVNLANLAEFANYLQEEVRTWSAQNPFQKIARETSATYFGTKQRLEWLLQQNEGIFIVHPLIKNGGNSHIIGIDCEKRVIYDPMERSMLRLQKESMGLCAGGDIDQCRGVGDVRQLKPQVKPQLQGKRRRKTRRGRGGSGDNGKRMRQMNVI